MVERKLPKLHTRVRFPSPAPFLFQRNYNHLSGQQAAQRCGVDRGCNDHRNPVNGRERTCMDATKNGDFVQVFRVSRTAHNGLDVGRVLPGSTPAEPPSPSRAPMPPYDAEVGRSFTASVVRYDNHVGTNTVQRPRDRPRRRSDSRQGSESHAGYYLYAAEVSGDWRSPP